MALSYYLIADIELTRTTISALVGGPYQTAKPSFDPSINYVLMSEKEAQTYVKLEGVYDPTSIDYMDMLMKIHWLQIGYNPETKEFISDEALQSFKLNL
jgi:hypothetical protein